MEWQALLAASREGRDEGAAVAEICRRFSGLVRKMGNQVHLWPVREEALAEGWLAVVGAVRTYDPLTGVPFPGYVESRVRYAVWNLFKRERRRWEREQLLTGGGSEEDPVGGDDPFGALPAKEDVGCLVEENWERQQLGIALGRLTPRQRLVVVRTFLGGATMTAVAADLGISVQAVSHLRQKGLRGLRKELAGMYLDERG